MKKFFLALAISIIAINAYSENSTFTAGINIIHIPILEYNGTPIFSDIDLKFRNDGLFEIVSYSGINADNATTNESLLINGAGMVIRILPDDTEGSQHQKFILELSSGQTLLVSHNIDLAPRINSLQEGDIVEFYGEYVWSSQGGLVHWTHHDPDGQHESGWLKHKNSIYQ